MKYKQKMFPALSRAIFTQSLIGLLFIIMQMSRPRFVFRRVLVTFKSENRIIDDSSTEATVCLNSKKTGETWNIQFKKCSYKRCWLWLTGQDGNIWVHYLNPEDIIERKSESIDLYQKKHGKMGYKWVKFPSILLRMDKVIH